MRTQKYTKYRRPLLWATVLLGLIALLYLWINKPGDPGVVFNVELVLDSQLLNHPEDPSQQASFVRLKFTQPINPDTLKGNITASLTPGLLFADSNPSVTWNLFDNNRIIEITSPWIQPHAGPGVLTFRLSSDIEAAIQPVGHLQTFSFMVSIPEQK